jgi:hypothetical protein
MDELRREMGLKSPIYRGQSFLGIRVILGRINISETDHVLKKILAHIINVLGQSRPAFLKKLPIKTIRARRFVVRKICNNSINFFLQKLTF